MKNLFSNNTKAMKLMFMLGYEDFNFCFNTKVSKLSKMVKFD